MTDTTTPASAPKLNKREIARLREIAVSRFPSFGNCRATTEHLHALGLIDKRGGRVAKTGRVMWHAEAVITDAGRSALQAHDSKDAPR